MKQEEYHAQCAVFEWAEYALKEYPDLDMMFATLNGIRLTPGLAVKAKKQGNKKGVPDIWLPVKRGKFSGLVIELKKLKGGKVSEEQQIYIDKLRKQGYCVLVCHGSDVAIAEIEYYLKGVVV